MPTVWDEEAAGSNPATPTQLTGHDKTADAMAFCLTASQKRSSGPSLECRSLCHPSGPDGGARPKARPEARAANLDGESGSWRRAGRSSCLGVGWAVSGPERVVSVEVCRIKPAFGHLSIADVEDLHNAVFELSSGPFGAGRE